VGSHEKVLSLRFDRCASDSSRTRSSKPSPTHSRGKLVQLVLLTFSAGALLFAADTLPPQLDSVTTRDQKVIHRWSLPGEPRGLAIGSDGTIYVGLAQPQAVLAIDPKSGAIKKKVVLDSADIASTKELVTLRTNPERTRLYIANGSDESATILSLPDLAVLREITTEGEPLRDALPDPRGRYLFLLGRSVHVYDIQGETEIHTIPLTEPMAIAISSNGSTLAVVANNDFGNAKATAVALYDTTNFRELVRDPLQTTERIEAALFADGDRSLVAISSDHLFEKELVTRPAKAMVAGANGTMRMPIEFGDLVNSQRICLPDKSGPQILAAAGGNQIVFAERRCNSSGAFSGSASHIVPTSVYGVDAYAITADANAVVATERAGFLTIYRVPRATAVK
jgi:hypothetical protein